MKAENREEKGNKVFWEKICGEDIRTPRAGAKIGTRGKVGNEPVAVIKQGKKTDTLSVEEYASALYGTKCVVTVEKK